ncbi:carbohydrate ABC transporter membrane protein 1 (CUT1 family) [Rhizobium sp. PP-F2F-G38]|uniref:Sugar ABC transporter permease n=2 Tax=Hyphomicrobiales TaxID=356 RepID=A0AA44CBK6_9HYPH|nr:sugar ABC transporter permease [Ferranicluibacter rubi]PYE30371.1 carbohydrate ABC transporter membrane protein 1 (CUT1 family) [Rhizobium sp. PP-WC-1G-195]PYE94041.1 carbohydrate ABC transporter membrane protein 1 (CUT1 family) [Rhizobium sp. PP-F2F-G38]TCP82828.1 carbohydrate ABC transporter membrane protein 1 (CUT1 family) [Rhizobium sp. PP-CC-2G-626]TCQ03775.1 carbohydrate ABC transporter membrane protein 1 (CUT1 family) [Rhizobium sp. PP-F2F-G36]TCQ20037.1 carbohydrate ABC transporter 
MTTITAHTPVATMTGRRSFVRRNLPYLLIAPSVIMLLVLIAYPLLFALRSSFYFWNLQIGPEPQAFVGFDNYVQALNAFDFQAALTNTLLLSFVGTALEFALGLSIALILLRALPGMNVVRALLILPTTIAPIVVGFLFRYLYDPGGGLLTWVLTSIGIPIPAVGLLGSPSTALAAVLFADIWQWTPFFAIVLYASLLSVPEEIIEAARLDRASAWTILMRIKLPLIKRTAIIIVMLRFMQLFNTFDTVLVLTRGGPGTSTRTLGYSLYEQGLINFNIGLVSAMTWITVLIVNIIVALYVFFAFRNEEW